MIVTIFLIGCMFAIIGLFEKFGFANAKVIIASVIEGLFIALNIVVYLMAKSFVERLYKGE
ncbi:hypothetical protein TKV_c07740 [Thermoanaerobacter kivui]|uniref:Uncharacterized protein n=2 Tax=Thermoanaerobacter kivui TaxID=2325 RepID=A0A097AQ91_THEKI|nr:hypothetical protein TKV_c07740 [Thermoanaerobacter kivui]